MLKPSERRQVYYDSVKRLIDILIAGFLLVAVAPLLLCMAATIALFMGTPVLFRQRRPGQRERMFTLYKFRTMDNRRDSNNRLLPDAARLTPLGKFIRNNSLDELPQLWNVLKGEMSLVGPRPLIDSYLPRYEPWQRRRHQVKPGLTGWAQVLGRNSIEWNRKFELDVWYVDNRSLWLDLKILVLTLNRVIRRDGINYSQSDSMPEFFGTDADRN